MPMLHWLLPNHLPFLDNTEKKARFLEVLAKLKTRDSLLRFAIFCWFSWKGRTCDKAGTDFMCFSGHHSLPTFSLLGIWQWINRWVESPGGSPGPYQPSYQRRLHPALARTCDEHSLQVRDRWCLLASLSYNEATFRKWLTSMEDKLNMDSFINLILRVPSKYSLIEIPSKRDLGENEFMKSVLGRLLSVTEATELLCQRFKVCFPEGSIMYLFPQYLKIRE